MSRPFATTKACFILLLSVGCGGPAAVATVPVSGKVTLDGQPVISGQVSFAAADDKVGAGLCTGIIGADGEYKISSDGKPGAPLGKYKVTVTPSMTPPVSGGSSVALQCPLHEFSIDASPDRSREQPGRRSI